MYKNKFDEKPFERIFKMTYYYVINGLCRKDQIYTHKWQLGAKNA